MTKDKWLGHGAILATNLIFGLNTPIAKTIVPEWISPYALTFVRMVFATLVFWGIGLLAPKEEVGKRDLWTIFWGALFGLVGAQVSFANALPIFLKVIIKLFYFGTQMPWRHGTAFHVPFDWPMGCLVSDKHTILTKRLCKDNGKKSEKLLLNSFYSLFNKIVLRFSGCG